MMERTVHTRPTGTFDVAFAVGNLRRRGWELIPTKAILSIMQGKNGIAVLQT